MLALILETFFSTDKNTEAQGPQVSGKEIKLEPSLLTSCQDKGLSQLIFHLFRAVSKTSQDVIHLVSSPPLPVDASDHFNFLSHCSAMRLL